ncbi:serine/threonine-protein kinase [Streptomyces sp. SAJ15]|uniref:serine/threonine-protein kinase n=1 Tax=Streptomyces sp. SAJ15 TaxID=2011095 RepID=UPI001185261F|nr:serine/threonine-protein kinase [Streptomyces sp. SAJ15]TVL93556.1 serine/threonine protein kinase [Streptomyces sp. SAJ15]
MHPLGEEDPQAVGAYRLLGRLGAGGMGRVYLGRSAGGRTVAVKIVHPHFALDEEFRARFRREVAAARRVGGAWTAPVLDADPEARVPWVATGYVAGPSLTQAVADSGPLPEASVRALAAGLAEALAAVHALGLVHRDVKPSNVLLTLDGPRLIDFGIARAVDGTVSLTSTGASIGSPGYMAPEQILGKDVAGAADVFSLGAVLAYAATGEGPFPGDSSAALLYKVVHEEAVLGPRLTGELRDLVAACLAKAPSARPTPERILHRLAPDRGAAGLVGPGWLPAPLVERVSRQAVELLNLEAAPPGPATPGTGPATPGTGPAPVQDAGPGPTLGAFGPPDPSYEKGPGHGRVPDPAHGREPGASYDGVPAPPGAPPRPGGPSGPAAPAPGPVAAAATPEDDPAPAGRRLSLTASVGGRRRPKALSCTLVLSVAGALAVAVFAVNGLPDGPGDARDYSADKGSARPASPDSRPGGGSETGAPRPEPSAQPSGTPSPGGPGAVPKAFLGTWRGSLTADSGLPAGELTITIRQGRTGAQVASGRQDVTLFVCHSKWKLVSATAKELVLDSRVKPEDREENCSLGSAEERFALRSDGSIRYTVRDEPGGNPSGTLRRLD